MADFSDIWDIKTTGIEEEISEYKWTIFGRAKSGKTTLSTKLFEDPLIGQFERGAKAVVSKKIFFPTWLDFKKFVKELKKGAKEGKDIPFKTLVIDTADVAWKKATKYICEQEGVEQIGELAYGKGYDLLSTEFLDMMNDLESLGISIVYISHDVDKDFQPKAGEAFNVTQMSVPERCMAIIRDMPDFIVFLSSDKSKDKDGKIIITRRAYFRSDGDIACGSRLKFMPDFIEFDDEAQLAVDITKAFNKAVELEKNKNEADIKLFLKENKEKTKVLQNIIKEEVTEKETSVEDNELEQAKRDLSAFAELLFERKIMNKIAVKKAIKNELGVTDINEATDTQEIYSFIEGLKEKEGIE